MHSEVNERMSGRVMALDLGEKRIGVAVSDERRTLARAHSVIRRTSRAADAEKIGRIVEEERVTLLVVGLPTLATGREGKKAAWARDYGESLANKLRMEIEFWDESYSTADAEKSLRSRNVGRERRRARVDAVAAAFILQTYLDAGRGR